MKKNIQKFLLYLMSILCFFPIIRIKVFSNIYVSLFKIVLCVFVALNVYKYRNIKYNKILIIHFIWMLYSILNIFWLKNITNYVKYNVYILEILILSFLFLNINLKSYDKYLKIFYIVIIFHGILGLLQIVTQDYYIKESDFYQFMFLRNEYYPLSLFVNVNEFAWVMNIGIILSYINIKNSNKNKKWIYIGIFLFQIFMLVKADSRGNLIGMGILILLFLKSKVIFGLGCISGGIYSVNKIFNFDFENMNSDATRINLLKNGIIFLKQTFGIGVGAGQVEEWMKYSSIYNVGTSINLHNFWAEILVSFGVMIFLLYIYYYYWCCKKLYNNSKYLLHKDKKLANISYGLFCMYFTNIILLMVGSNSLGCTWLIFLQGLTLGIIKLGEKVK